MAIKKNISLQAYNTFGVDVRARFFAELRKLHSLKQMVAGQISDISPLLVLGGGSNVLFTKDFDGLVLLNKIKGWYVLEENDQEVVIEVNSGESWTSLVDFTVARGWFGLENLSLIPGTVGAAPIQNIGAYGVEVKDVIVEVKAFNLKTGKMEIFSKSACQFGYRSSIFKTDFPGKYFISSVTFRLSKIPDVHLEYGGLKEALAGIEHPSSHEVSEAVKAIRRSKLPEPDKIHNAGSFFKNPVVDSNVAGRLLEDYPGMPFYPQSNGSVKLAAGWLIEKAGWKGKKAGDAGVHEKQALVLVNYGQASGMEILSLAKDIQQSIFSQFEIRLELEVNVC